jgi:four helix bundle protein
LIFDLEEINMKPQELEDRLINFAVMVIGVVEVLPNSKAGNHIAGQLVRSGTSPAPNYGEARSAESRKDFIHKMKISLKELRESVIWLNIVLRKNLVDERLVTKVIAECGELIAIFVASTRTADCESISSKIKNQHSEIINRQ